MFGAFVATVWAVENGMRDGVVNGEEACAPRCFMCRWRKERISDAIRAAMKEMGR